MKHIYCISGFGADERVFSKLDFGDNLIQFIPWLIPLKKESIEEYAKRMSEKIQHENPILLGLSFGGIMCIEIAKLIKAHKVILISSVKSFREFPLWMRLAGKSKLHKFFPLRSFKILEPLQNYNLGIENKDELKLVREYRSSIGQQYTDWAIDQILHWKSEWIPENCIHIHGGRDHIFPIKNIKADYVIADGGHFMIMNRAQKVNAIIREIL
ncbi:MAG: alpha/beta hydrolase [Ginsengibacter sp.]